MVRLGDLCFRFEAKSFLWIVNGLSVAFIIFVAFDHNIVQFRAVGSLLFTLSVGGLIQIRSWLSGWQIGYSRGRLLLRGRRPGTEWSDDSTEQACRGR